MMIDSRLTVFSLSEQWLPNVVVLGKFQFGDGSGSDDDQRGWCQLA
jgi:hypothetical protein